MSRRILLCFSNAHINFGFEEFKSLAKLFRIKWLEHLNPKESENHPRPIRVIESASTDDRFRLLLKRSVTLRFAAELLTDQHPSYELLHSELKNFPSTSKETWERMRTQSFCFRLTCVFAKRSSQYLIRRIEEFNYLNLEGVIKLKNPENTFQLVELHVTREKPDDSEGDTVESDETLLSVCFCRLIDKGNIHLSSKFDLEHRHFIGNTSMDATLSLIQANLSGIVDGSLVCDPYVGTGSLIVAAGYYGGYCVGTEISYKILHGIGKSSRKDVKFRGPNENVKANFAQYGITDKYLSVIIADASRPLLWRETPLFDAIVTDPPYGIREKSAKVGSRKGGEVKQEGFRVPCKVQYGYEQSYVDLLNFAAKYLVIGGRISFWLPVLYEKYKEEHIPRHPCLSLLHNCEQRLSSIYGRRLIVMEKQREMSAEDAEMPENPFSQRSLRDSILPKTGRHQKVTQ